LNGTVSFNALGAMTMGYSNGSVQVSAPPVSSLVGVGGISLSSNGSTVSISELNYSFFDPNRNAFRMTRTGFVGSIQIQPVPNMPNVQFDRAAMEINFSVTTGQTGTVTLSEYIGFYTKNVSTLSLYASSSTSQSVAFSGTGQSSILNGHRLLSIGWTTTISVGDYWLGVMYRSTTAGGAASVSQYVASQVSTLASGIWGSTTAASNQMRLGQGVYSVSSAALPGSIAFSEINGNSSQYNQPPLVFFNSGTV
jgi:hypothetical protein